MWFCNRCRVWRRGQARTCYVPGCCVELHVMFPRIVLLPGSGVLAAPQFLHLPHESPGARVGSSSYCI
uniref:Uncharacterized protein n=1 Tax=Arundo donax TaxID=35708 RepID=A0A0A9DU67_ARUDO